MEIKYVSVAEMAAIEKEADASGLSYSHMMEQAGNNLAISVCDAYSQVEDTSVLGLVGPGNNGGDTLVALSVLSGWGWKTCAYLMKPRVDDPLVHRHIEAGGEVVEGHLDPDLVQLGELLEQYTVLLDGVLGTGFRLPLRSDFARVLDYTRRYAVSSRKRHVVAVDCPSGVDCDSGQAAEEAVPAEMTVSMAAAKQGLLKFPAYNLVGNLCFVGIGLGDIIPHPECWKRIRRFIVTREWVQQVLPHRPLNSHKGTFGTALVIAGSLIYTGAALLAGKAAYRSGAGLVTMGVPRSLHAALAGHFPEATWLLLPEEQGGIAPDEGGILEQSLERATALLVGPGFGLAEPAGAFLARLFDGRRTSSLPNLVLDADGLKLVSHLEDWQNRLPSPAILTPHPGEMEFLTGLKKDFIQNDRIAVAEKYARSWGHVVLLKGAFTVIADPLGRTGVLPVATPALARAGTGDVLAGLAVGLCAQGVPAFEAACSAAWIHAQSGISSGRKIGPASVLAGDILDQVSEVFRELEN